MIILGGTSCGGRICLEVFRCRGCLGPFFGVFRSEGGGSLCFFRLKSSAFQPGGRCS